MANEEHVKRLKQGVAEWNAWREREPSAVPTLSGAKLSGANLSGANLTRADLYRADLDGTNLTHANLSSATLFDAKLNGANLTAANLTAANLYGAYLGGTNLTHANLSGAKLEFANLTAAILTNADLTNAWLLFTVLGHADLTSAIGLQTCLHGGPSIIDNETLQKSGLLPLSFLRGVGLPDRLIEYLPALLNQAIQYYSCFISYSTKDQDFADRIHADLQNNGVRCWFAPHDLKIGDHLLDIPDAAIRVRDKVLLILSENSIGSSWVKKEVIAAFDEEDRRKTTVLFPVRLDDAVMETNEAWAAQLRHRLIGDFRNWKDHDGYKRSFERVLRDLKRATEK